MKKKKLLAIHKLHCRRPALYTSVLQVFSKFSKIDQFFGLLFRHSVLPGSGIAAVVYFLWRRDP